MQLRSSLMCLGTPFPCSARSLRSEIRLQIFLGCRLGGQCLGGRGPQVSVSRDLAEQGNGVSVHICSSRSEDRNQMTDAESVSCCAM
jgi:hypothetical protein